MSISNLLIFFCSHSILYARHNLFSTVICYLPTEHLWEIHLFSMLCGLNATFLLHWRMHVLLLWSLLWEIKIYLHLKQNLMHKSLTFCIYITSNLNEICKSVCLWWNSIYNRVDAGQGTKEIKSGKTIHYSTYNGRKVQLVYCILNGK